MQLKNEERQRCEVWTRVMGYHRPVQSFNIGKKSEFAERMFFTEPQAGQSVRYQTCWKPQQARRLACR